jgi:carbonic anhydrase
MAFITYILIVRVLAGAVTGQNWNYDLLGPSSWPQRYPACGRSAQSPIGIKTACTVYRSFEPFRFSADYTLTNNLTLVHDGTTVDGDYAGTNGSSLTLTGGGLNGTFTFHLHWGTNYSIGSEHQV